MSLAFLKRWPDILSLLRSRKATLKKFFYAHGVRRPEHVARRLALLDETRPIHKDWTLIELNQLKASMLIETIELLNRQIGDMDERIAKAFASHQKRSLFKELPGAGPAMAPRLLCAISLAPDPSASGLQKYLGLAPVIEKSGNRKWTHRRWSAPKFQHQTMVEWAGLTVQHCRWARVYYQQAKQAGKGRYTILRALAFKWLRIIARCIETSTPYNEETYIAQLIERKSPLAAELQQTRTLSKPS